MVAIFVDVVRVARDVVTTDNNDEEVTNHHQKISAVLDQCVPCSARMVSKKTVGDVIYVPVVTAVHQFSPFNYQPETQATLPLNSRSISQHSFQIRSQQMFRLAS